MGAAGLVEAQLALQQFGHHRLLLVVQSGNLQNQTSSRQDSNGRGLNPSVVIIVVILTVVFLLSGFLHLLARCCGRVAARREPSEGTMSALHGQLQQLFHLHDSGVEQAFIDTLPVFPYKAICGLKEGTDCAVCLSEFESEDRLRLLPKCKHAFHIECIDTWLLSHSTCPLCRCALISDDATPSNGAFSDSGRLGSTRSMRSEGFGDDSRRNSDTSRRRSSLHGGGSELGKEDDVLAMGIGSPEIQPVLDRSESEESVGSVLSVKLGRVERRSTNGSSISGSSILRGRSYSMGSYEYVVDPANLQVVIAPTPYPGRGNSREFVNGATQPRHRSVFSDGIPELGSIPGTPADELFWATRGLATPEYGATRGMGTPEFLTARTPDFIMSSKDEGNATSRLNLGHLASEASLVPKMESQEEGMAAALAEERDCEGKGAHEEGKGKQKAVAEVCSKDFCTIDLKAKKPEAGSSSSAQGTSPITVDPKAGEGASSFAQRALSPLQEVVFQETAAQESEESRILAGLERFFGTGWRSNVGLEKLTETMSRRDREGTSSRSNRAASEQGAESLKDHSNTSRRTFSFRFSVPESLSRKTRRSRHSLSAGKEAFDTASTNTGDSGSKDGGGFETASKESLAGLDTSSVGSIESSWLAPALPQQERAGNQIDNNHNQQGASLARKTIHWLMGRDRRVVHTASFSPSPNHRNDENL